MPRVPIRRSPAAPATTPRPRVSSAVTRRGRFVEEVYHEDDDEWEDAGVGAARTLGCAMMLAMYVLILVAVWLVVS